MKPLTIKEKGTSPLRAVWIVILWGVLCHAAFGQIPPTPIKKTVAKSALPPKIVSASKAMAKTVAPPSRKIVLSWNQYTNIYFQVEATTNLADWYQVTNIFPKWPTNCAFPANKKSEFFRIQTINQ